jgi:Family of unknown function (DUF6498)
MFNSYFKNPSLLFLLAGNLYCLWYYQHHPDGFVTVVWVYWFQSIIIGLFNFIDLLTIKKFDGSTLKLNDEPVTPANKGCMAWFFLVHFGGFHLGYLVFLFIQFRITAIDTNFLLLAVLAFMAEVIVSFIRRKQQEKNTNINIGTLFFLPYLRIVPMHLMILLPAFLNLQPSIVFLVLKTIADLLSFALYQHLFSKSRTDNTPIV